MARYPPVGMDVPMKRMIGIHRASLIQNRHLWLDRFARHFAGDQRALTEGETMSVKNAGVALAALHVLEAVAEKAVECHEKGIPMTYGDLAFAALPAIEHGIVDAGIRDHEFRPAPKKPGRRKAIDKPEDLPAK